MAALKFIKLLHSQARTDAVGLSMLGADQQRYEFEIASGCAALVIAALAAEMGKLPEPEGPLQFIRGKGITIAMSHEGDPMFLLTLEGGAVLPIELRAGDLTKLIEELQVLSKTVESGLTRQ